MQLFTEGGVWLIFERGGPGKWYAETPTGEYAYGEQQGLYEWRNGERIAYTGADRQASSRNGKWTVSGRPEPYISGNEYSLTQYNERTN